MRCNYEPFVDSNVTICHFVASGGSRNLKREDWYNRIRNLPLREFSQLAPSDIASFKEWKRFNPSRLNYPISKSLALKLLNKQVQDFKLDARIRASLKKDLAMLENLSA